MDSLKTPRFLQTIVEREAGSATVRYIIFPQVCLQAENN